MTRFFSELAFHPSLNEIVPAGSSGRLVVFTGGNNSGKSAYLKKTIDDPNKLYIGVNRFFSFHHLGLFIDNTDEKNQWYSNMQSQAASQQYQNFEGSFFNASAAITRLTDERRKVLFDTFTTLFGTRIEVLPETLNNEFSNKYISVDGDSLSVTSSGTRLFLGILAALMDDRFTTVAIDEPELGLSPTLQRRLADIIIRGEHKVLLFPHNPNIVISTHSHLFLDRLVPPNNWVVTKKGSLIAGEQCSGFSQLHDIQFRLLGNDLSELYLPDVVMFVEGETDKIYLEKVLSLHVPGRRLVVQACGGDIATRLRYWADSLGDMQLSPYRNRTFVIFDRIKQAGIERACVQAGLPPQSMIEWNANGIEFLYPTEILGGIYRQPHLEIGSLTIDGDFVSVGGLTYKKMELCMKVVETLTVSTQLPDELGEKLLRPLREMIP
jgi:predicted ATPase